MANITSEQLIEAAKKAKIDLDKAKSKDDVIQVFKNHVPTVGYKSIGKMLAGATPESAVGKWAARIAQSESK